MIYDITILSLTAGTGTERSEKNDYRVAGTLAVEHNFGVLTFSGSLKLRELKIEVFDTEGKEIWTRKLEN